ncbi:Maleylacetoacetate isomerase / Glutathione S-transferase [hydrothermal vent metagenome]|uniref:Maleylacetoacetate isomerase / Glutathione S-transferase n=1 Tax=hydrothermal vent metagenome TaxID=652676 RepID=A0A3B0R5E9_9ZZZZ
MSEFQLYCFAESGNAYKAALMLELCDLDWSVEFVDFFNGETKTPQYRENVNELGEVPVLVHRKKSFTQSGLILNYLSEFTGKFGPANKTEEHEILRWILFDNHKFTSYMGTRRFFLEFMKTGDTDVSRFLEERILGALEVVEKHLENRRFIATSSLSIADISMCGYLYYGDELRIDLDKFPNVTAWTKRIAATDRWKHPYDLMPRAIAS